MLTLKIISLLITIYCTITEMARFKTINEVNRPSLFIIAIGAVSFITLQWLV